MKRTHIRTLAAAAAASCLFSGCMMDIEGVSSGTAAETVEVTTAVTADFSRKVPEELSADEKNGGKVLKIVSYNDEFKDVFESLYGVENLPGDVTFEYRIIDRVSTEYSDELMQEILHGSEPADIVIVEPDYMYDYVNSDIVYPMKELGIGSKETAEMYPYTLSLGEDTEDVLKAVSWQVEPGVFFYRRDIAKAVFGSDDPEYINTQISDGSWYNTASALSEYGIRILASPEESYRTYRQNSRYAWVDMEGYIVISEDSRRWAVNSEYEIANNYIHNYPMWSAEWMHEMSADGTTFGFYLPSWGCDGVLVHNAESSGAEWGVCVPDFPYYWGGAFICVPKNTDNADLCGDIIREVCCDSDKLLAYTEETGDCCNNITALEKFAESNNGYSQFLRQDPFDVYCKAAPKITANYLTGYDAKLDELYKYAMQDFFTGKCTFEEAEENFIASTQY